MTKLYTITVENDDYYCLATVEVQFTQVDTSYDHVFGVKRETNLEPSTIDILSIVHLDANSSDIKANHRLLTEIKEKAYRKAIKDY